MKPYRGAREIVGLALVGLLACFPGVPAAWAQAGADEPEAEDAAPAGSPETEEAAQVEEVAEPTAAAEAAPEEAKAAGEFFFDAEVWVAQGAGLDYRPATVQDAGDPTLSNFITVGHGTEDSGRYSVGYGIPQNVGTIRFTYFARSETAALADDAAGEFIFGELAAHPTYAGFENDGLADSFSATTRTRLQDWRLAFARRAFRTPHFAGDWSAGWTRVTHIRDMEVLYPVLLPDLPALVPPLVECPQGVCPNLNPTADSAKISSTFEGRGLTGGFDFDFNLWQEKVVIEAAVYGAVLRGKIDPIYQSTTNAYVCNGPLVNDDDELIPECAAPQVVAAPPYDYFADPVDDQIAVGNFVVQRPLPLGIQGQSVSTTSFVVESQIGVRWRALGWLEVFGGFRDSRYSDVGLDLRPKAAAVELDSSGFTLRGFESIDETKRSVTYEGFYGGLSFRLK